MISHVELFRGGLVFRAHRLLYHSTLGSRVIKQKKLSVWVSIARDDRAGAECAIDTHTLNPQPGSDLARDALVEMIERDFEEKHYS